MNGGIMISYVYVPFLLSSLLLLLDIHLSFSFANTPSFHLNPAMLSWQLLINRAMILWVSQSGGDEYEYQLTV
jgi:hypothetical protein